MLKPKWGLRVVTLSKANRDTGCCFWTARGATRSGNLMMALAVIDAYTLTRQNQQKGVRNDQRPQHETDGRAGSGPVQR